MNERPARQGIRQRAIYTRWRALPLDTAIVAAVLGLQALHVAVHQLLGAAGADVDIVNIGGEQDVSTWFTSMLFAFAAAAAALAAMAADGRAWAWGAVAAVMALFSLDEIAMLHEQVESSIDAAGIVRVMLPLGALAALLIALVVLRRFTPRQRVLLLLAAMSLFLAQLTAAINDAADLGSLATDPLGTLEESLEVLVGAFALAAAVPSAGAVVGARLSSRIESRE